MAAANASAAARMTSKEVFRPGQSNARPSITQTDGSRRGVKRPCHTVKRGKSAQAEITSSISQG